MPESDKACHPVRMRFFQKFAIERRNAIDFKITGEMRGKRIKHVPRLTSLFFVAIVMLSSPALSSDGQISLVVGFAAGGTSSTAARIFAESVEHITRISTVVENRPGAGGAIAADWVLRQKGTQTLLFMSSTSSLKTSPQSGLVPIGILAAFSYVAVTKREFSCESC